MGTAILFCLIAFSLTLVNSLSFVSNALGSNMVLQRAPQKANLWGWSTKGGSVITVAFNNNKYTTTSAADGAWSVFLPPTSAGGPHTIDIASDAGESQSLTNVLFGDVWVCSGQSNMGFAVGQVFNATEEIAAAAKYPNIRVFTVANNWSHVPLEELANVRPWAPASPSNIGGFSATCWFFGRNLYDSINVPLGLFNDNWGGTRVQAWSSPDALAKCNVTSGNSLKPIDKHGSTLVHKVKVDDQNDPSALWNAMINPILHQTIKGAIWYQGEQNSGEANYYACGFPSMITDWRAKWKGDTSKDFPFYFVQLAPWLQNSNQNEATIRLAQLYALKLSNVGFATAMDAGDPTSPYGSVHPRYKQIVGLRLSIAARGLTYGQPIQYKGPQASDYKVLSDGPNARVQVIYTPNTIGSGLVVKSKPCEDSVPAAECAGFEIGTEDGKWTQGTYAVSGNDVIVSATTANSKVTGVRYGWANYPIATLYNKDDLPAIPFAIPNPIKPVA